jgi:hypothetical protein
MSKAEDDDLDAWGDGFDREYGQDLAEQEHAQLVAERDRLRAQVEQLKEAADTDAVRLAAAYAATGNALARIAELKQALSKYGDHGNLCGSRDGELCTCGLATALAKEVP